MTVERTKSFGKDYNKLPQKVREKLDRQLLTLLANFRHPSLYAKKMKGKGKIWEARVDYKHRFTFQITNDILILRRVGSHDMLKKP